MKRLIIVLTVMAIASSVFAWGNGWQSYGTSGNPLLEAYYTTIYANTISPIVASTGAIGTYNSVRADSGIFGATSLYPAGSSADMVLSSGSTYDINSSAGAIAWTAKANTNFAISGGNVNFTVTGKVGGDTVNATTLKVGTSTLLTGIYTGNATGWTLENTIDTNVVSGATATSRSSVQMKAATATLTAALCCRTVVDTIFISCVPADTAAVRAGSVDYLIVK